MYSVNQRDTHTFTSEYLEDGQAAGSGQSYELEIKWVQ